MEYLPLFLYFSLALLISFLCSLMESVLLSSQLSYIKMKESEGVKVAEKVRKLKTETARPLSAILSLNTIANTVGASGVGVEVSHIFSSQWFGVASAILTISILVFSEILPKVIGSRYWRSLIFTLYPVLKVMIVLMFPLVWLLERVSSMVAGKNAEQTISREEISSIANMGEEEGIIEDDENKMIQNVMNLSNIKVSEVMTPRAVITMAQEDMSVEEFFEKRDIYTHSRIPLYGKSQDVITGYVLRQTVFEKMAEGKRSMLLKEISHDVIMSPDSQPLDILGELFLTKGEQIAVIFDEYGGAEGVVTMEDFVETVIGSEIVDEKDSIPDMQQYAREKWKKRIEILSKQTNSAK